MPAVALKKRKELERSGAGINRLAALGGKNSLIVFYDGSLVHFPETTKSGVICATEPELIRAYAEHISRAASAVRAPNVVTTIGVVREIQRGIKKPLAYAESAKEETQHSMNYRLAMDNLETALILLEEEVRVSELESPIPRSLVSRAVAEFGRYSARTHQKVVSLSDPRRGRKSRREARRDVVDEQLVFATLVSRLCYPSPVVAPQLAGRGETYTLDKPSTALVTVDADHVRLSRALHQIARAVLPTELRPAIERHKVYLERGKKCNAAYSGHKERNCRFTPDQAEAGRKILIALDTDIPVRYRMAG